MNSVASPTLSNTLSTVTTTTNSSASVSSAIATSSTSVTGYNYAEIFDEIDWGLVSLIDIENEWRAELEQIEKVCNSFYSFLIIYKIFFFLVTSTG